MHSSDDGYAALHQRVGRAHLASSCRSASRAPSRCSSNSEYRSIRDTVYSIIGHGLATRFPDLRFMPVENGSQWVPTAIKQFKKLYDRSPGAFDEDPMVALHRSIIVHPFFEEDVLELVELVGPDNVVFGSDFPHPEGLADPPDVRRRDRTVCPRRTRPRSWAAHLSKLMKCDPAEKLVSVS